MPKSHDFLQIAKPTLNPPEHGSPRRSRFIADPISTRLVEHASIIASCGNSPISSAPIVGRAFRDLPDNMKLRLIAAVRAVDLDHLPTLEIARERDRDQGYSL
jgi:hypothetical protein